MSDLTPYPEAPDSAAPASTWPRLAVMTVVASGWAFLAVRSLSLTARLAPMSLQKAVTWTTFRSLNQLAVLAVGLTAWLALVPSGRQRLGLRTPSWRGLGMTVLAVPVTWAAAAWVAIAVAMPILMEELRTRGLGASRQNAGPLATELTGASLPALLLAGVVLAALAEETLFRGAIWGTFDALARRLVRAPARGDDALPGSGDGVRRFVRGGGVATVLAAVVFGAMHADVPGGVGIVRIVSTTCLGLAAGSVRALTRSLWPAVLLHALHNTLSLAQSRGWFAGLGDSVYGVPPVVIATALAGLAALVVLARRPRRVAAQLAAQIAYGWFFTCRHVWPLAQPVAAFTSHSLRQSDWPAVVRHVSPGSHALAYVHASPSFTAPGLRHLVPVVSG